MKKEARLLARKAVDSLILSVEHFNRPWDRGRVDAVLILLDHSFEMLLKAAILHRGGTIRERRAKQTIGFNECLRRAVSNGDIKFLDETQALSIQMINSLRDAALHHLVDVSEPQLYLHAQAGLTLFRDILMKTFSMDLTHEMPARVLPVSTTPPMDLDALFTGEVETIRKLLQPGSRRRTEAAARLRALAILDGSVRGEQLQPGEGDLRRLMKQLRTSSRWEDIFPGVSTINFTTSGIGASIALRLTKKEGFPVQLVPEGTPDAAVVGVRRVDELGFYKFGRDQLAEAVGMSGPKTTAAIRFLRLEADLECSKEIVIGKARFRRFSPKAVERVKEALVKTPIAEMWKKHGPRRRKGGAATVARAAE